MKKKFKMLNLRCAKRKFPTESNLLKSDTKIKSWECVKIGDAKINGAKIQIGQAKYLRTD